jgi:hypothetical protein
MTMPRGTDWSRAFDEPISLPKGKTLRTLRDAALNITKLPKAEHDAEEWQAAVEALILVAELGGPTMFAQIAVMLGAEPPRRAGVRSIAQGSSLGKRKLARDQ